MPQVWRQGSQTHEGRPDFESLNLKFEPKEAELKTLSEEIDGLKKQLDTQQSLLNDEARGKLKPIS